MINRKIGILFLTFHFMIFCAVIIIVALTKFLPDYHNLLRKCTLENGFFEWGSAIVLFFIFFYGLFFLFINGKEDTLPRKYKIIIGMVAVFALFAAFEELSWGQHFFKFKSTAFFSEYNKQREMNIHNLMPATPFNTIVNTTFYAVFLFVPIMLRLFKNNMFAKRLRVNKVIAYTPSIHMLLMLCFGISLQAYFQLATFTDTVALCFYSAVIAFLIFKNKESRRVDTVVHLMLMMGASVFFMISYSIFRFKNMQYEIREFVFMYTFLYWFIESTLLLKKEKIIR